MAAWVFFSGSVRLIASFAVMAYLTVWYSFGTFAFAARFSFLLFTVPAIFWSVMFVSPFSLPIHFWMSFVSPVGMTGETRSQCISEAGILIGAVFLPSWVVITR